MPLTILIPDQLLDMMTTTPTKDMSLDRHCPGAPARRRALRRTSLDDCVRTARFQSVATNLVAAFGRVEQLVERRCPDAPVKAEKTLRRRPASPPRSLSPTCPPAPKKVQAMRRRPDSPPPLDHTTLGRPPVYPR